jgi:hypothetical protein
VQPYERTIAKVELGFGLIRACDRLDTGQCLVVIEQAFNNGSPACLWHQ